MVGGRFLIRAHSSQLTAYTTTMVDTHCATLTNCCGMIALFRQDRLIDPPIYTSSSKSSSRSIETTAGSTVAVHLTVKHAKDNNNRHLPPLFWIISRDDRLSKKKHGWGGAGETQQTSDKKMSLIAFEKISVEMYLFFLPYMT